MSRHTSSHLHTEHYTYPVADTGDYDGNINIQSDADQMLIATSYGASDDDEVNARRLVACWNACSGLDTEGLENMVAIGESIATMNDRATTWHLKAIAEANQLRAQRDELLAALRSVWLWMEDQSDSQSKGGHATFDLMLLREQLDIAQAAIAKAEG